MNDLTQEYLKQIIKYDPDTGLIYWARYRNWRTPLGKAAGSPDKDGYTKLRINHKAYLAHRLAFLYMTGAWPKNQVDHINLDKGDNRWANLREATAAQNAANRRVRSTKKEPKGVYPDGCGWRAITGIGGKTRHIGYFKTQEEANAAYLADARKTHGEFARS